MLARLRRFQLPKSIFGRALLIIILPIMIMQMLVAYFFFNAHWSRVTASLSEGVAGDIAVAVELYQETPTAANAERLDALFRPDMELSVALRSGEDLPTSNRAAFFSALDQTLRRALSSALEQEFWFDTTRYPNHIDIRVKVDEGYLRFIAARERVFAPTGFVFIFWLITATLVLSSVSIVFIRRQADPIALLANAADTFGKGGDVSDFRPSGASEVRRAGQSFLKMRSRLQRHLEQRTMMLAGVSHDLRTPLTRLKLHMAMQKQDADTAAARRDIDEMEAMLKGYLDFARGLGSEAPEVMDMQDFLARLCAKHDGAKLIGTTDEALEIRPRLLRRGIGNLVSNALKFGTRCEIHTEAGPEALRIHVDDDGPGIPEDLRADAFKAFERLDTARNQNIEGIGLGLAIARDIAQTHGGTLALDKSPLGGLRATLRLPR